MNIEELREFCLSVKGATEGFPFGNFGKAAKNILVFKVMDKMFCYVDIFPSDGVFTILIKCNPELAGGLKSKYEGINNSGRNGNPNWIAVHIERDVPDELIKDLILNSVNEAIETLSKKKQQDYHERYESM